MVGLDFNFIYFRHVLSSNSEIPMQRLRKAVLLRRWLRFGWMMPCSLAALSGFSGQEAAAQSMTMYSAAFCNPFCLTESKDSPQTKITFSGLPSFFSTNGGDFTDQNFKGSFAIDPFGSPLKSGSITSLQYIANANHDSFDGITSNGPYLFLRGLNEDTKDGDELYFAFRLSGQLVAGTSQSLSIIPNTDGDNPSDNNLISNASYLCRLTNTGGPQNCKSGGDYFGLLTGLNDSIISNIPDPDPDPDAAVPGPLPLLGVGSAFACARKIRARKRAIQAAAAKP